MNSLEYLMSSSETRPCDQQPHCNVRSVTKASAKCNQWTRTYLKICDTRYVIYKVCDTRTRYKNKIKILDTRMYLVIKWRKYNQTPFVGTEIQSLASKAALITLFAWRHCKYFFRVTKKITVVYLLRNWRFQWEKLWSGKTSNFSK